MSIPRVSAAEKTDCVDSPTFRQLRDTLKGNFKGEWFRESARVVENGDIRNVNEGHIAGAPKDAPEKVRTLE